MVGSAPGGSRVRCLAAPLGPPSPFGTGATCRLGSCSRSPCGVAPCSNCNAGRAALEPLGAAVTPRALALESLGAAAVRPQPRALEPLVAAAAGPPLDPLGAPLGDPPLDPLPSAACGRKRNPWLRGRTLEC